jgi:ABC-2 type transport system permease protein
MANALHLNPQKMLALLRKEISIFLSSLIGYSVIIVFLISVGLLVWVLPETGFNLIENGAANLDSLFILAPWVFMFLVPAITMRSFAEENKSGTIELLLTKPLSDTQIVLGKFFASLLLIIFSLAPTLVYYFTVHWMASPYGNIDGGSIAGSYIGLLFLGGSFTAIGVFASSLTESQIVSFIFALILCLLFYIGFGYIGHIFTSGNSGNLIVQLGISSHYSSISRGVIDTRDLVYFISLSAFFLLLSRFVLEKRKW